MGRFSGRVGTATAFELLTDHLRVSGEDHPETLGPRHDLAAWQGGADDSARAAAALEDLLTDRERVLRPDYPHTCKTRAELAHWRGKPATAPPQS